MAFEISEPLQFLATRSGIRGVAASGRPGVRRRSTETDLLGAEECELGRGVEFREIKGEGNLLEEGEDEEIDDEFEFEFEVEGDMYLDETTRDLGFL